MRVEQLGFGPGSGFGLFHLFVVALLAAAAVLVIEAVVRGNGGWAHSHAGGSPVNGAEPEPLRILDERFARGEIDVDDYKVRRELLARA